MRGLPGRHHLPLQRVLMINRLRRAVTRRYPSRQFIAGVTQC